MRHSEERRDEEAATNQSGPPLAEIHIALDVTPLKRLDRVRQHRQQIEARQQQ
jgi:hypothetical protein